jgi:hypothetical protein
MNDHQTITAERGRRAEDLRAAAIAALEQQGIAAGMLLDLDDDTCVAAGPKSAILMLLNGVAPALQVIDAPRVEVPEGWKLVPVEPTDEMAGAYETVAPAPFFVDAYRAMLAAAPALPIARQAQPTDSDAWISVDERLPGIREEVLVDCGYLTIAQRTDDKQDPENHEGWALDYCNSHARAITFWMPLPKPPALKSEQKG